MKDYRTESNTFVVYKNWEEFFKVLNAEEASALIMALFAYAKRGEIPAFSGALQMAFMMMSQQLDRDGAKWMETCERRSESAKKRWNKQNQTDANACKCIKAYANDSDNDYENENENETVNENVNENENKNDMCADAQGQTRARAQGEAFIPPTVSEVAAYCAERKNGIDAQYFVDYFSATGWMLGKTPMQDWQATVRRWERNGIRSAPRPAKQPYRNSNSSIDMEAVEALIRRQL